MLNGIMFILITFPLTTRQEFSACVQASPVHFPNGSPRVCRNSVPVSMSPDGARVIPRRRQVKTLEIYRFVLFFTHGRRCIKYFYRVHASSYGPPEIYSVMSS